jgi:hypothetical protein
VQPARRELFVAKLQQLSRAVPTTVADLLTRRPTAIEWYNKQHARHYTTSQMYTQISQRRHLVGKLLNNHVPPSRYETETETGATNLIHPPAINGLFPILYNGILRRVSGGYPEK